MLHGALLYPSLTRGGRQLDGVGLFFCGGEAGPRGAGSGADTRCDRCHKSWLSKADFT